MERCKTCKFRQEIDGDFYCVSDKITEPTSETSDDMLIYTYSEGGSFQVGENFGCVHHAQK